MSVKRLNKLANTPFKHPLLALEVLQAIEEPVWILSRKESKRQLESIVDSFSCHLMKGGDRLVLRIYIYIHTTTSRVLQYLPTSRLPRPTSKFHTIEEL